MKRVATFVVAIGLLGVSLPASSASAAPGGSTLNRKLPESKFTGVGFGDAIDFVRDVSGANITVNWKALAEANVTPETPVNVRMSNVSVRKVLNVLLAEAAGGNDALTFVIEDGVIEITTRAIADQRMIVKVYPVDDLLFEVPDFGDNVPNFNLQQKSGSSGSGGGSNGGGGGGGGGNSLFNQPAGGANKTPAKTKDDRAKDLVDLITSTIRPDVWRDNGGTASIRYYNGNLIISAPQSVHEAIGG